MPKCDLNLRPLNWKQGINEEGRRLSAECAIAQDAHLILSNKMRLEALLPLQILIYDNTARIIQDGLAELPPSALGSFSFHDATPAYEDLPAMGAFVAGWFALNAQSLDDVWNQVLEAGYTECGITIRIGPVELGGPVDWLWNVTTDRHLAISKKATKRTLL
jgi:hypothetical protein